ncbi:MAG: flagellin [Chloroflexi bacterium]|nr:MAG: flagellin [Chloroflexota bacterium]
MPLIINTNVQALNAQRNLGATGAKMGKALEQLSSGLRINRAADDAAGLAISEKLRSQVRGLNQGARNAQDGISMIQTAEGALNEVHCMLQRMRELAVQAGNSTLGANDRTAIGEEMLTLTNEIDNTASRTKFNGLSLLTGALSTSNAGTGTLAVGTALATTASATVSAVDVSKLKAGTTYTFTKVDSDTARLSDGTTSVDVDIADATLAADGALTISFSGAHQASITVVGASAKTTDDVLTDLNGLTIITSGGSGTATYQVGAQSSDTITVDYADMRSAAIGTGGSEIGVLVTDNTSVSTVAKANTLLASIDTSIQDVSTQRAKFGASQNQIEAAINSLGVAAENLSASESRIRDADIAQVSTKLVSAQIMQQAGVSVLAQANSSAQIVSTLLQRM